MHVGSTVTMRTYTKAWRHATIVDTGMDTLTGTQSIFLVRHPHFQGLVHFYQKLDAVKGLRLNVGNRAYWIEED